MEEEILFTGNISLKNILIKEVPSSRKIDADLEKQSKDKWEEIKNNAKKTHSQIWDSDLYRLEDITKQQDVITLFLSTIPFSIRISLNSFTEKIKNLGRSFRPNGIFFSCFLKTSDDYHVFIKKSSKLYSERNIYFIGGVLSKTEHDLSLKRDITEPIINEVFEETNLKTTPDDLFLKSLYITENFNCCMLIEINTKKTKRELEDNFESKDGEVENLEFIRSDKIKDFIKNLPHKDSVKFQLANIL